MLSIDQIAKANSGHPGIALGAAPILFSLFQNHISISKKNTSWINRDRFVLSAGHGSSLLYANSHLLSLGLSNEDLQNFRSLNSKTPGHPEYNLEHGIEATTGPLGQGLAMAVGMAIAEEHLSAVFNREDFNIIDHYTYVLVGDGCLQEGISEEALSLAGHLGLKKLIILHDSNDIQLDGKVSLTSSVDLKKRIESLNISYYYVEDGNDTTQINKAIKKAKKGNKPSFIEIKTKIGEGSLVEGTNKIHGNPPTKEDLEHIRKYYNWDYAPFTVLDEVEKEYKRIVKAGNKECFNWTKMFSLYSSKYPEQASKFVSYSKKIDVDLNLVSSLLPEKADATRNSFGIVLDKLSDIYPNIIGGSADLTASTKAKGRDGDFSITNRLGRNINFGVREHAMGAITNGITLHGGLVAFCAGFFVFSDYLKPAIRLAAMMNIPSLFIFSHDSIAVGEDGPTHEPIEQLTALRSIPNLCVFRPADAKETFYSLKVALASRNNPSVIVTTRQNVPYLKQTNYNDFLDGGYLLTEGDGEYLIITSGSETATCLQVVSKTKLKGDVFVLPSISLLEKSNVSEKIYSYPNLIIGVEMGDATHLYKFADIVLDINTFGRSGKYQDVIASFRFDADSLVEDINEILDTLE
jgi:transketolase